MVNYVFWLIKDLANITEPFWQLTRGNVKWQWADRHEKVLEQIKETISVKALAHYNTEWLTELIVDASPVGLGAVLGQRNPATKTKQE
jgi:hypothetical protein